MLMKIILILLMNMLSVGFYTLLEQKILGYMNNRLGPNKILILGMIQFIMDLIKLMFKDNIYLLMLNYLMFYIFILMFFSLSLFMWILMPFLINLVNFKFFMIFF